MKFIIKWIINELLSVVSILLFLLAIIISHLYIPKETLQFIQLSMVITFFGLWIVFNQLDMMERN